MHVTSPMMIQQRTVAVMIAAAELAEMFASSPTVKV